MVQYVKIRLHATLDKWVKDQRGLEIMEIVLIASLVLVGSIALWRFIGDGVKDRLFQLCEGVAGTGKCGAAPTKTP